MLERVVRISNQVVKKFNLDLGEICLNARIWDFGFDVKGYDSFYFECDETMLNFLQSLPISADTPCDRVGKEFKIG